MAAKVFPKFPTRIQRPTGVVTSTGHIVTPGAPQKVSAPLVRGTTGSFAPPPPKFPAHASAVPFTSP